MKHFMGQSDDVGDSDWDDVASVHSRGVRKVTSLNTMRKDFRCRVSAQ